MSRHDSLSRRGFLVGSATAGASLALMQGCSLTASQDTGNSMLALPQGHEPPVRLPDLNPARWIWYPSQRCLQNTFVLFRRNVSLVGKPKKATGWISADSRYLLTVNGKRIQWGPSPCDPRWLEADPLDLTGALVAGENVIGATVLFYGVGEGTWPAGKPGFLFRLEIEYADGRVETVISDEKWRAHLCRAWPPGHYKRDFCRTLQEEFDARLYPYAWEMAEFKPDHDWLSAMPLQCSPNDPPVCASYPDYLHGFHGESDACELRARSTALLKEYVVPASELAESLWLTWKRPPQEYFEFGVPAAFDVDRSPAFTEGGPGKWHVQLDGRRGAVLTFELAEQVIGWPGFAIEAPAGTVIELLVHEAHDVGGPPLLNTHWNSWSRFVCREGVNHFETFDFESVRWLQLHIHGDPGKVTVSDIHVRRRIFPWPHPVSVQVDETELQRLIGATVNTINNSCQETCVDGMARERQQYSGDCGHQLHALHLAFGETTLSRRFITTFSQGQAPDGYFLDCWPAYDRLARMMERTVGLAGWGPLIDHGVGFNFDCWHHYLYTGNLKDLDDPYPRLLRFFDYLTTICDERGLLKVEGLGIPCVWIDHVAYQKQHHKQCAFNLYAAAMLQHPLPAICRAFGDKQRAERAEAFGRELLAAAVKAFWSREHRTFVVNLPWLAKEEDIRLCDRSLATAILFDQCPDGQTDVSLRALVDCPKNMGFSYPANANWRLWALGKMGRADVILKDLRERWATMDSVLLNNTLQEDWKVTADSGSQWSHCPVSPLFVLYMTIAGIRPLEPGFGRCEIRPQLADLRELSLTARTVRGPVEFSSKGLKGDRKMTISLPPRIAGELVLPDAERVELEPTAAAVTGQRRYRLPSGKTVKLHLRTT